MAELHATYDVMLTPVVTRVPPPLGHLSMGLDHEVLLPRVIEWMAFAPLANAAGTPAISLPLGMDDLTGLPVGMMFGAAAGNEALLLQLALQLEQAAPWPSLATTG
jgi:amidase